MLGFRSSVVAPERRSWAKERSERALLCIDGVSVSFDGFKALTDLSMVLDDGELRCIIGPNGAGKTTLMDVITGKTKPDRGAVFFVDEGQDLTSFAEHTIARWGIGRKFQRPTVFPKHSVLENLELALKSGKGVFGGLFSRIRGVDRDRIEHIIETIGLADKRDFIAGVLSHGQKQWLEIGMLLAQDPRVLLVDEPVAGMTHREVEHTAELLTGLAGKHTVVVVEHDMDFIRSIAQDTVTVLHEGQVLAEGSLDTVAEDPQVKEVYLGS